MCSSGCGASLFGSAVVDLWFILGWPDSCWFSVCSSGDLERWGFDAMWFSCGSDVVHAFVE